MEMTTNLETFSLIKREVMRIKRTKIKVITKYLKNKQLENFDSQYWQRLEGEYPRFLANQQFWLMYPVSPIFIPFLNSSVFSIFFIY